MRKRQSAAVKSNITKAAVLGILHNNEQGMTKRELKSRFHLIPETEDNRSDVWRLGQTLAVLEYNEEIHTRLVANKYTERVYYPGRG